MEVTAEPPVIRSRLAAAGTARVELLGHWNLRSTRERTDALLGDLSSSNQTSAHWDLTGIDDLDVAGATLLWRAWSGKQPPALMLRPEDEGIFKQFAALPPRGARAAGAASPNDVLRPLLSLGQVALSFASHAFGMLNLLGEVALSFVTVLGRPTEIPWREISAVVYRSGLTSLPITALVGGICKPA